MSVLDVFNQDAFGVVSLTDSINRMPYQPGRLGKMGLFTNKGVNTTSVMIESREGRLHLIESSPRGSEGQANPKNKRAARSFAVPHFKLSGTVLADSVQNVRAFGQESQSQTVAQLVNDEIADQRASHEVTLEYLRMGAISGIVVDGDGATPLYNLYTEFGITPPEVDFDFAAADMKLKTMEVRRTIEDALGNMFFSGVHAFCSDQFFDALISHSDVKDAYNRWRDGAFLREDQRVTGGFEFAGVMWENYRGKVGSVDFIADGDCRFVPTGVRNLFQTINAPADYVETVNTIGKPFYAKQEAMKFGKGIEVETQSNPLTMCGWPGALVRGYSGS